MSDVFDPPADGDGDEGFDTGDDPPTDDQLANLGLLERKQAEVAAIVDERERGEAAKWYQAALAGYDEPEERWG